MWRIFADRIIIAALLTGLAAIFAASCSGSGDVAVPRPKGNPRIEAPDTIYRQVDGLPVKWLVNAAAVDSVTAHRSDAIWLNVIYPGGAATMFCTFTPVTPATCADVIENRSERMALNAGSNESEIISFTSEGGFAVKLMKTLHGTVTPLQFLATSPGIVATGAVYLPQLSAATADSLAPVMEYLNRDLMYALTRLDHR